MSEQDPSAASQALPRGNAVIKNELFSAAECQVLKSLPIPMENARLSGEDSDTEAAREVKVAQRQLVQLSDDTKWIYQRLANFVTTTKALGFDIEKIHAPLKVQHYQAGGFHGWHNDIANPRYRTRKLGITVQLSSPDEYEGGDFQFFHHPDPSSVPRTLGCGVIYPAYMVHQVAPVLSGERVSLTAWVLGPPLR